MPRELFETVAAPAVHVSARSPVTVAVSVVAHLLVIAIVVIAPLLAIDVLPTPYDRIDRVVLAEAVPPPPLVRVADAPVASHVTTTSPPAMVVPVSPPDGIQEEGPALARVPTIGTAGDTGAGVVNGVFTGTSYTASLPAPPARPAPTGPVRAGGRIREPQKLSSIQPIYPAIARSARIEGIVVIEATIGTDGSVREARVRTSVPLLDQAALDAVRQWRYRPTTLNGVPVAIIMTVSVRFTLQQP